MDGVDELDVVDKVDFPGEVDKVAFVDELDTVGATDKGKHQRLMGESISSAATAMASCRAPHSPLAR